MSHTPGPWFVDAGSMDAKVVCPDGRYFLVGDILYHTENRDNANLIAAAPDLLAALKGLLEVIGERYDGLVSDAFDEEDLAPTYAAIAKAEGGAQ